MPAVDDFVLILPQASNSQIKEQITAVQAMRQQVRAESAQESETFIQRCEQLDVHVNGLMCKWRAAAADAADVMNFDDTTCHLDQDDDQRADLALQPAA